MSHTLSLAGGFTECRQAHGSEVVFQLYVDLLLLFCALSSLVSSFVCFLVYVSSACLCGVYASLISLHGHGSHSTGFRV